LEAQRLANKNLQASVAQTTSMATALRMQLKIIESEQATRLAEAAKKPKLQLTINKNPLLPTSNRQIIPRDQAETSQTFEVVMTNIGDAAAHHGTLRVIIDAKDVQMITSGANALIRSSSRRMRSEWSM